MLEHKPGIGAGLALGEAGVIRGRGAVGVTRGLVVREERSEESPGLLSVAELGWTRQLQTE